LVPRFPRLAGGEPCKRHLLDVGIDTDDWGIALKNTLRQAPDVILMGSGAEVATCLEAAEKLEADDLATRVVSMPCWDRFVESGREYQEQVLPPSVRARISVEAAGILGWDRWVGDDGESIGMTGFGASGPADELAMLPFVSMPPSPWQKSRWKYARRNSPSVMERRPTLSWFCAASRIAASSITRSSLGEMEFCAASRRACLMAAGRRREPTWSAR